MLTTLPLRSPQDLIPEDFPAINFGWDWGNATQVLSWKYLPNSNYFIETNLVNTEYTFNVDFAVNFEVDSTEALDDDFEADLEFNTDNIVQDISIKQTLNYFVSDFFKIKRGWEYKNLRMKYVRSFAVE